MSYVYLLRSKAKSDETYVGSTNDLKRRLAEHNGGRRQHTRKHCPWKLVVAIAFRHEASGDAFEEYLKSGSGRGFARRHFLTGDS
jgi:predicted GIY-YIG superfamily endonuclease